MSVSWYDVQDLQQVLWAKAEGIERWTRLDLLKRTWKMSIWSEEDDEEITLPDPEVPLVYSLHYAQPGRQDWQDQLPPGTWFFMSYRNPVTEPSKTCRDRDLRPPATQFCRGFGYLCQICAHLPRFR